MRIQLGTEDLHVMPISNCEFCENRCSERHTSVQSVNDILPHFLKSSSLVVVIGTRVHKNYDATMTFVDTGAVNFYPHPPHLSSSLGAIRYKRPKNTVFFFKDAKETAFNTYREIV
jgi:hypothetical protein